MTTQPPPHTRRCGLKKPVICREESETPHLMTIEMLTRVAGVISMTRLMTIEMLTRVAGVISMTRLMTIEMLTRVAGVIGVTVDLVEVGHGVLVLTNAGGALRRWRSSALVVVIEHLTRHAGVVGVTRLMTIEMLTRHTGVISMTRLMTIEMLTRHTGVIGVTRGVGVLSAGAWRAGSVDAS